MGVTDKNTMTDIKPRIVAVIPCYNTASHIAEVVTKCLPHVSQVIVVDDGSTDGTVEVAKKTGALVLNSNKNIAFWGLQAPFSVASAALGARR